MSGSYVPTSWVDGTTKLGPTNLNKLEDGVRDAYTQAHGIFNVKDAAYGAKGDGTTDDTTAIQAAITAAQTAVSVVTGSIVYLPPGVYKISVPLLITNDNVQIMGAGRGVPFDGAVGGLPGPTTIQMASGFTGTAAIKVEQSSPTTTIKGCTLRDFNIWGGSVLAANVHGIYLNTDSALVQNIWIDSCTGNNIHLKGNSNGDCCFNTIRDCQIRSCTGNGIYFDTNSSDSWILNCLFYGVKGNAIDCQQPGAHIIGNLISNTTGKGINGTTYDTKVQNNRIQNNNGGVYLSNTTNAYGSFQITDNKIWNSSYTTDNTNDSINVTSSTANTRGGVISGNDFLTNAISNRARYHINIASSNIVDLVIGQNSYLAYDSPATSSYGTAAISDGGTRTQIAPIRLAGSGSASSHTGDTNETTLGSVTIPGGLMGTNGKLVIWSLWTYTNNADNKTMKVKLGSTAFFQQTQTTTGLAQVYTTVSNRGAQNSQVGPSIGLTGPGNGTAAVVTGTIDTSTDQTLALTGTLGTGTDTITLEAWRVEVLQG